MYFYLLSLLVLLPILAFSGWASAKVNSAFSAFDKVPNRACMTGYDTAVHLMRNRGVTDISVNRVNGKLTDHYHPKKKQVNLSMSTFGSSSVAAVAVAAHEVGHVMQKKAGYVPYKIRSALVPLANLRSSSSASCSTFSGSLLRSPTVSGRSMRESRCTDFPRCSR